MSHSLLKPGLLLLLTHMVIGCGGTTKVQQIPVETAPVEQIEAPQIDSPESLLASARTANDPQEDLIKLLEHSAQQNCAKALQIAELLDEEISQRIFLQRLYLTKANCLLRQNSYSQAHEALSQIDDSPSFLLRKRQLSYQIALANSDWWEAAEALYFIAEKSYETDVKIWELLHKLPTKALEDYRSQLSALSSQLELALIQRNLTRNTASAMRDLNNWRRKHPQHSFASRWPDSLKNALAIKTYYKNIAVLLPLTGQRRIQGMAIKDGILSASFSNSDTERQLTFIDTNTWRDAPPENIEDFDLIIGPLLRENIEYIQPLIPETTKFLSLNRINNTAALNGQFYFSLAPEDEARQLVEYLFERGITRPMLVVAEGSAYTRMEVTFSQMWSELTGEAPIMLQFTDNKQLRKEVNDKLSLTESKARVRKISSLLRPELHTFERNRRDVDAIVIFANATQTELINPLIEASISPFAEIIPVFSTSRSHSKTLSANGLRDLRNLYIIDMPWMLKTPQYSWLQQQTQELWPGRRDTQNRLFALGYDAFNLAPSLEFLDLLPNQSWRGMTGELILDEKNQINRKSTLAQFNEQEVLPVASD